MPNHYLIFLSFTVDFNDFDSSPEDDNNENVNVQKEAGGMLTKDFHLALTVTIQPQAIYLERDRNIFLNNCKFKNRRHVFFITGLAYFWHIPTAELDLLKQFEYTFHKTLLIWKTLLWETQKKNYTCSNM